MYSRKCKKLLKGFRIKFSRGGTRSQETGARTNREDQKASPDPYQKQAGTKQF